MATLERLIKDLEFENEDLIRQIKDEIEQIDEIQKNTAEKSIGNVQLEEVIEKANHETKSLHGQFKQNKEIVESLNNATGLLQRHCGDLQNSLKLKLEAAEFQRQEHLKVIDVYTERWLKYEAEYEKRPLAQEARQLKLEAANLDSEEKELFQKKEELKEQVKSYDYHRTLLKNQKEETIKCIIQLVKLKITTNNMMKELDEAEKEETVLKQKHGQKNQELADLYLQLEQKVKDEEEAARIETSQHEEAHKTPMFSFDQRTDIKPKPKKEHRQSPKLSKLTTPKPFKLPKFSMPKMPKFPKFPQLPKLPSFYSSPRMNFDSRVMSPKEKSPQAQVHQQQQLIPNAQMKTTERQIQKEEGGDCDHLMNTDSISFNEVGAEIKGDYTSDTNGNKNDNNVNIVGEDCDQERIYQVPLDQSNKQFFKEMPSSESEDIQSPATPSNLQFRFSPGQHAEQLKLLKQSPAGGYFRAGRPMFQNSNDTAMMECENSEKEYTNTFNSENQFLGFMHEKAVGDASDVGDIHTNDPIEGKVSSFAIPKSSPSSFSFDSPRVSVNTPISNNKNTIFNFGSNDSNAATSAFDFTAPTTDSPSIGTVFQPSLESPNTSSAFNLGTSELNFNTTDGDCDSSMFDFTIRSDKQQNDVGAMNMFNFEGAYSMTSPPSDNSGFLFNVRNTTSTSSPAASQPTFSFTF